MDSAPNPDSLTALLKPRNIALIGASERAPHAAALMRNLFRFGFPKDRIYPVNPRYEQLFGRDGSLMGIWGVGDLRQPMDVHVDGEGVIYVAECYQRITIYDPDGAVQCRIGGEEEVLPGNFIAPHGLWVDSRGDLYVGEVTVSSGAAARLAPFTAQCFQKFVRSG